MIDNRLWICFAEKNACCLQDFISSQPRRVDNRRRQALQFWYPAPDVGALGIELFALNHGIKDTEIGRSICAGAGDPLPARSIVGEVGVNERIPKPSFALLPWDKQMLDKKRCRYHANTVVHVARRP